MANPFDGRRYPIIADLCARLLHVPQDSRSALTGRKFAPARVSLLLTERSTSNGRLCHEVPSMDRGIRTHETPRSTCRFPP